MATNGGRDEGLRAARAVVAARWLRPGALGPGGARRLEDLAALAGRTVHAVGIGRKWVAGRPTGTLSVRVHVRAKLPRRLLGARDRIPARIDGVPTDVVASAPARLRGPLCAPAAPRAGAAGRAAGAECSRRRREARRPLVAGVSVAHRAVTAGTIGAFCASTRRGEGGAAFLLSNNHVLADGNRGRPGDAVYQPGPYDGGTAAHGVADLARFVPIRMGGRAANRVDAALARVRPGVAWRPEVCGVGRVAGVAPVEEGLAVRKHGRTTGLTEGVVTDLAYEALVGMDDEDPWVEARFVDQVRVAAAEEGGVLGAGGDSGALLLTARGAPRAVGLYFAGPDDGSYGVANPIDAVLELLGAVLL